MAAAAARLAIVCLPGSTAQVPARGPFAEIVRLEVGVATPDLPLAVIAAAMDLADTAGCDWLIVPGPGETLLPDALDLAAPAIGAYDAVFGAAHVEGSREVVFRPSRLAFDAAERLPHALLHWWLGKTHLVRVAAARAVLAGLDAGSGEGETGWLAYLFALWADHRCIKLAQPLLQLAEEPPMLGEEGRRAVLDRLARQPVFLPVPFGETTYLLPYTGTNAGIEREQTRGLFFEAAELHALRERVGPGRRIVDIGANTGNHTVFFAGPMQAAVVVPFEPLPEIAEILSRTVAANGLANVDLGRLGTGVSDRPGRARVVRSERGGLGASRLQADETGEIPVLRLDDVLTFAPEFLKIDVESMEMQVLLGAKRTIATSRPVIFIEIANENTNSFVEWLKMSGYGIEKIFSDKGHSNYLIAPVGT